MSELTDTINEISKIAATGGSAVFVPSTGEIVTIKSLTLAQQKTIIESSVDRTLSVLFFNTTFTKIIEQNIGQLSNFNTIDRIAFALALRKQISNEITVDGITYALTSIIENNKHIQKIAKDITVASTNFKFYVKQPSLEYDNKINSILLRKYKDDAIQGNKLKTLISDLFSHEIFKFIEKIEVQSSGKQINLYQNIQEGIKLIESISSSEFVEVVKYINAVRDEEKAYTNIPGTTAYIDILPEFFVV